MLSSTFIDEVGYLSYDEYAADLLCEAINRPYEWRSVIVTTKKEGIVAIFCRKPQATAPAVGFHRIRQI